MVDRYLELLRPLGIEQPKVRFGLRVPAEAEAVAARLCELPQLRAGYVVLNPGAGWDSRLWPIERFAEVAQELGRSGVPSVITWGGNRERGWAEAIVAAAGGAAVLAPPTSLLELTAVLRRARLVVASDTGPLHLAAAIGTPTVGLFGTTRREATGPYGAGHVLLQATYDDSPGRKLPGANNEAMRQISVPMVLEACRGVLSGKDGTSRSLPAVSPRSQDQAA
jgi:ADP-heptose:LPS heptosyltransferase